MRIAFAWLTCALCSLFPAAARAENAPKNVKVCVRIDVKSWTKDGTTSTSDGAPKNGSPTAPVRPPEPAPAAPPNATPIDGASPDAERPPDAPVPPGAQAPPRETTLAAPEEADFSAVDPVLYLKRLIEYEVTHEAGFESVESGCGQTLVVEMYPVRHGWTAFARYSGNEREEKVDVVHLDELGIFAERVTTALLRDKSIAETLKRTTVLRADSDRRTRRIETHTHLLLGMGSGVRAGSLPTVPDATSPAKDAFRVETPLEFEIGARNKFRGWALDATGKLDVGLTERAARLSAGGGQTDYSVGLGAGMHFLSYADPDGVNTLYYGAGGSFELSRYETQGARDSHGDQPAPSGLWGGGLDVDLVLGYEFMRTSTLHFFVQTTVSLPAYVFDAQNDQSIVHSYIPSAYALLGLLL